MGPFVYSPIQTNRHSKHSTISTISTGVPESRCGPGYSVETTTFSLSASAEGSRAAGDQSSARPVRDVGPVATVLRSEPSHGALLPRPLVSSLPHLGRLRVRPQHALRLKTYEAVTFIARSGSSLRDAKI